MTGDLGRTAGLAAGGDLAGKICLQIGPDDNRAALALTAVSSQRGAFRHRRLLCSGKGVFLWPQVAAAADKDRSAALGATDVQLRRLVQGDRLAGYPDCAGRCRDAAGNLGLATGHQQHAAIFGRGAGRVDVATLFAGQGIDIPASRLQRNFGRLDAAGVVNVAGPALDRDARGIARGLQHHVIRRGQRRRATRVDGSRVADIAPDQDGIAARLDGTKVDNIALSRAAETQRTVCHECGRVSRTSTGDETTTRCDFAAGCHDHALRIDQIQATGRADGAGDRRGGSPGDHVQGRTGTVVELDFIARANRETVPVDDAACTVLRDS